MDCNTARMLVTFFGRQGSELAPEDAAELDAHLAGCPKCAELVKFERAFDDRVGQAMLAVPVPGGLKGKLLDGVAAARGAWYREKVYAVAGLAAAVLATVVGVVAYQMATAPVLSTTEIVAEADDRIQNRARWAEDELGRHGLTFAPEKPFDLTQLENVGEASFQGRQVPFLYFINPAKNARATVYVVRKTDFDWSQLPRNGSIAPSVYGYQVAVLNDTRRKDVAYVVVFTGAGLELFLQEQSQL